MQRIVGLLKKYYIDAKILRRNDYVVYVKASDKIADILRRLGLIKR